MTNSLRAGPMVCRHERVRQRQGRDRGGVQQGRRAEDDTEGRDKQHLTKEMIPGCELDPIE